MPPAHPASAHPNQFLKRVLWLWDKCLGQSQGCGLSRPCHQNKPYTRGCGTAQSNVKALRRSIVGIRFLPSNVKPRFDSATGAGVCSRAAKNWKSGLVINSLLRARPFAVNFLMCCWRIAGETVMHRRAEHLGGPRNVAKFDVNDRYYLRSAMTRLAELVNALIATLAAR